MEPKDYGSAKAYADAVRNWVTASQCWMVGQQMAMMQNLYSQQQMLQSSMPQMQQNAIQQNVSPLQRFGIRRIFRIDITPHQTTITQQYIIPSFTRRVAAELLDFSILFIIKMIIVWLLIEVELIDFDQYDEVLSNDVDVQTFIDLTQGLFHLEVISKLISSLFEALCISYGFMNCPAGCTPGKYTVGIQVVSCHNIVPVPGTFDRVVVTRSARVGFKNSLIRSLIKNMVTNFLFPISTIFYMFRWNRSVYDLAAKTVVVHL